MPVGAMEQEHFCRGMASERCCSTTLVSRSFLPPFCQARKKNPPRRE